MKMCVVDTELIRNWKEMILALNALCPTLMIYNARAKSPQPADSSVVDKRVQAFDPGGEAKELPLIHITSGNQPWVDKASLSQFQFEVHLRNKSWAVFDCLRTFFMSSLKRDEGTLQFALNFYQW